MNFGNEPLPAMLERLARRWRGRGDTLRRGRGGDPRAENSTRAPWRNRETQWIVLDADHLYWLEQDRQGSYDDSVVKRARRACR